VACHPTPLLVVGFGITPISETFGARRAPLFRTLSAWTSSIPRQPLPPRLQLRFPPTLRPPHRSSGSPEQGCRVGGRTTPLLAFTVTSKKSGGLTSDYRPVPSEPLPQGSAVGDNSVDGNGDSDLWVAYICIRCIRTISISFVSVTKERSISSRPCLSDWLQPH
jgi:hypothetical protein